MKVKKDVRNTKQMAKMACLNPSVSIVTLNTDTQTTSKIVRMDFKK